MSYRRNWPKVLVFTIMIMMVLGSAMLAGASENPPAEPTISPDRVVVLGSSVPEYFPNGNTQRDPVASKLPAPEDTELLSYKIDGDENAVSTGFYKSSDGFEVYIWNDGGNSFRYRVVSNHSVYHAYAKGGNQGGNLYMYYAGPDGEVLNPFGVDQDAAGLSQPGGGWSHITFYYDEVQLGELEITKSVLLGDVLDPDGIIEEAFEFIVTGPSYPEGEEFIYPEDFDEQGVLLLENLIPGEYTIGEVDPGSEWSVSVKVDGMDGDLITNMNLLEIDVDVDPGERTEVEFINTYVPGELIINKQWIFDELYFDDEIPEFITVLIEGPSFGEDGIEVELNEGNEWTYENKNLLPGKYTVSELDVDTNTWTVIYVVDEVSSTDPVEVDVVNGETTEVTIQNIFLFQDETIWAYSKAAYDDGARGETIPGTVYRNNEIAQSNAWGWTNFIKTEGTHEFLLFAGAGQNDTERGTKVGTLTVVVSGGSATVTYMVDEPYTISEYHLWVGETPLPMVRQGRREVYTSAPGQFPYTDGAVVEVNVDAGFFVAAHGVVRIPYMTE